MTDITVCVPTIPSRAVYLSRALTSIGAQTLPPDRVIIEEDLAREGAAATRQRALERVSTEFVAFLDDDDEFLPGHLQLLREEIDRPDPTSGLRPDVVYPWFHVFGGTDPFAGRAFAPFDPELLMRSQYVPITVLARTQSVLDAGGFREVPNGYGETNEDWELWKEMLRRGATLRHLPQRTWIWNHHRKNTSGREKDPA